MLRGFGSGSAAAKLLCITCFHIIILPCALFYTHSRKPLVRKTQPAPLPVASPLHQESCHRDFSPSPHLPWCSPKLPSLHARLRTLVFARSLAEGLEPLFALAQKWGFWALAMHWIMMKGTFDLTTAENARQGSARGSVDEIKIPLDVSRISLWGSHQK